MRKPDKFLLTLVIAMYFVSVSACSGNITPQPMTSQKTPTRTKEPTNTKPPTSTKAPLPVAPSPIQTNTLLPAIPAIGEIIRFGAGGGGGPGGLCYKNDGTTVQKEVYGAMPGGSVDPYGGDLARICLLGLELGADYEIRIFSPDRQRILQGNVEISNEIEEFTFKWPLGLPDGIWHVILKAQEGFITEGSLDVLPTPKISIEIPNKKTDLLLQFPPRKWLSIDFPADGAVVLGENFLPNSQVEIFFFEHLGGNLYTLISKERIQTNSQGGLKITISSDFKPGKKYRVSAMQFPNDDFQTAKDEAPYDYFTVKCLGAPLPRMDIYYQGYVCTKEDKVLLRSAPNHFGAAIDSLPVGTQFTVLDGPSCADNWSWWQIRTDYGATGWIAEGGDNVDPYFICPLP